MRRAAHGASIAYRIHRPAIVDGAHRAPALLLIHGLASNCSRFEEWVETTSLAERHALIRIDLRGHGDAETRRRIGMAWWCADLGVALRAEDGQPAVVVGHSLGAQVPLHFAQRHPEFVSGLMLIDPVFRRALHGRAVCIARAAPLYAAAAALIRALQPWVCIVAAWCRWTGALDRAAREALVSPQAEQALTARYSSMRADLRHGPPAVYLQDLVEMFRPVPHPQALDVPVLALLSTGAAFADATAMRAELAGGGLAPNGQRWIACRPGFFLPVRLLSPLFRRRFLEELQRLHEAG